MKIFLFTIIVAACLIGCAGMNSGESADPDVATANERIDKLIKRIDQKAEGKPGLWALKFKGIQARVITDNKADRMRILVPIATADTLNGDNLYRLMQANFDSALDARYCIAKDVVWAAFIHPLTALSDDEFLSGLAQTINLAATYGSSFTSGALLFRGGDSKELHDKLYREILERGKEVTI